jgi:hypothetical protein
MPNNIVPAKERKFVVFESKLIELFQKECSVCGEKEKMTKQHIIGTAISVVFILISSIMSDCFICHTSVIVGTMYAFCIDEYVLSLKHCIESMAHTAL